MEKQKKKRGPVWKHREYIQHTYIPLYETFQTVKHFLNAMKRLYLPSTIKPAKNSQMFHLLHQSRKYKSHHKADHYKNQHGPPTVMGSLTAVSRERRVASLSSNKTTNSHCWIVN